MNIPVLLFLLLFLQAMIQRPEVRGDSVRVRDLEGVTHLAVCTPEDCPTCTEFMIAEVERLSRERYWCGRWAVIIACTSGGDSSFADLIRDRFEPRVPLWLMRYDTLAGLIPSGRLITPCVMTRSADGRVREVRPITSRALDAAARYFDSLYTAGTQVQGP